MLFVGFGIDDPFDVETLLETSRTELGDSAATHYTLQRKADPKRRNDLQRRFIETITFEEFAEIPAILRTLRRKKP